MCTLTLAWRAFPDAPVVVAANRDEATDRPSTPPAVRGGDSGGHEDGDGDGDGDGARSSNGNVDIAPRVLAPRDERAGGTWIGVNEHGLFAGITNRWTDADLAGERSRGLLVDDALAATSAGEAANRVRDSVERVEYDGFNLVIADASDALLLEWDGEFAETSFDPGVHVVVNVGADDDFDVPTVRSAVGERQAANARAARTTIQVRDDESVGDWLTRARRVLADHEFGLCIHGDGYGTRSSSIVVVRDSGTVEYEYADGPPCETPFEPVAHDL